MSEKFRVSFFRGLKLTWPRVKSVTLEELADRMSRARADNKSDLPMLNLGVFEGGAKRDHLKCLTGAMVDYDAGQVSIDEAAARLREIGVSALLYTSPSSTNESPRWRALAPYSREMGPSEHQGMTDRLNGALGGIIDDAASWETQQRFYYGQAKFREAKKGGGKADPVELVLIEGNPIDLLSIAPAPRPARVKVARDDTGDLSDLLGDDEDDLFDLVRTSPLGLSESEIDEVLANIPNDGEGAHYDDYLKVGMAIHHEYSGSAEGFEKFCEWAEQSSKFSLANAKGRWRSFNQDTKSPTTFRSLIQESNANRKAKDFAVALVADTSLDDILNGPSVLHGEIIAPPNGRHQPWVRSSALTKEPNPEWTTQIEEVEHEDEDGTKWKSYKSSLNNLVLFLENDPRLFGCIAFNEFTQEIVLIKTPARVSLKRDKDSDAPKRTLEGPLWENVDPINGTLWSDAHDYAIREFFEAPKKHAGHGIKVTDRDLLAAVTIVAQRNRFHPVRNRLDDLASQWDPETMPSRIDRLFVDYLGTPDDAYHRDIARTTLLGAVARVYEPGHKYDYAVILEGAQGKRKSTFIETLAMGWYAELEGDLQDRKAMVEKMQGAWILEIPELQGFNKADVTILKAMMSARTDKVRLSYAKRASVFKRQCIFIGSTNDSDYLRDPTGARRFLPVQCDIDSIDIDALKDEVLWLWAEAAYTYKKMRSGSHSEFLPLYLTNETAARQAIEMQSSRTVESTESALAGEILAWLDTPIGAEFDDLEPGAKQEYRNETCMAQVWREMLARTGAIPHNEAMKIGAALNRIGWSRSAGPVLSPTLRKKYGKTRIYSRP